jgi:hypothetical protein
MRAAPGRASARRRIARILQRVRITFALVLRHTRSRSKVNSALQNVGTPFVLAEEPLASQARYATATLTYPIYLLPTTAVTSISSSMEGMASALMTRNVLAGIGPSP